ncbi:protein ABSCISIC ACID-INSENSITIVE 5 [Abrus precatorius]|uniref:Protein ABSCISIC ACID-INSENSITIVE 5 n=1 Tax=Abrus precatorius TaxID=3816 RepID=A0A8B8KK34_ABRPR|nr:protein ABSCISIC ACID-INSENSITIVE 5 [Abrus precatorius]
MAFQQSGQKVQLQNPEATFSQLSKQNSILTLTLDEFQCKSGKSFGSMNMDEFLASIWSSDDNQVNPPLPTHNEAAKSKGVAKEPTQPTTSKQGSFSVPPPICNKTVDEVWSQIHKDKPQHNAANDNLGKNETLKKQQTLGEMTLEDFLIKAGVVQESSSHQPRTTCNNIATNGPLNASYRLRPAMRMGFSTQHDTGNNVSINGLEAHQMLLQNNNLVVKDQATSRTLEKCQTLPESGGNGNRKRIIDGPPEVVVERRQRRMMKNRESAARSRARRQAYTVELETELNLLTEENEKLKQILAEAERKRKQEISQRKHSTVAQKRTEKWRAMRRPISAAW